MIFKKGDRVRNDDGQAGEVLFVDRNGLEAQVAFHRFTLKVRSESLSMMTPDEDMPLPVAPVKARRTPASRVSARRVPKC
jgi:hypothetical protein